jgi:hypothetical protein
MPGGQRWAIPVSTTVPAATGPKSQATGPELLLALPLEGEAALPLPLGKTVNAAMNPQTRIRLEIAAQLDRSAMYRPPWDLFQTLLQIGSDRPFVNWQCPPMDICCEAGRFSAAWTSDRPECCTDSFSAVELAVRAARANAPGRPGCAPV